MTNAANAVDTFVDYGSDNGIAGIAVGRDGTSYMVYDDGNDVGRPEYSQGVGMATCNGGACGTLRHIKTIAALAAALLVMVSRVGAQECSRLQGASPDEMTSYLSETVRSPANESCAAFAINQLGSLRYKPAIPALTKWLELRWPPGAHQKQRRFVIEHDGSTIYPAATALEAMGKDALPAVLNAIKTNPIPRREWMEVAAEVWMTAHKDHAPTGVALLKQEADRATDPGTRQRVGWAAFYAVGWCNPSEQEQCRAALNIQNRN